jgi:hypothetical protein
MTGESVGAGLRTNKNDEKSNNDALIRTDADA